MTDYARIRTGICISFFLHFMLFQTQWTPLRPHAGVGERLARETTSSRPLFGETITVAIESADENALRGDGADKLQKERRAYIEALAAAVHARRFVSPEANAGLIGLAWYSFTVTRDGTFRDVRLAVSSGNAALDRAAGVAVREADGVVKRPPALGAEEIPLVMAVKYQYAL